MRRSQILRQSKLAARLQFGPQISELARQKRQADTNLVTGIAAQAAAARAIAASARQERRPMKRAFDAELHSNRSVNAGIASDLASLGPSADRFRGAADREAALATTLTTRARTDALGGLSDLVTGAAKGRAYAVQNLLQQHGKDVGDLNAKLRELQGERGAAASKGYLDLLGKEQDRALRRQSNRETRRYHNAQIDLRTGINPKTGKPLPGKGKGAGQFTQSEIHRATEKHKDGIREAQRWLARGTPEDLLTTGGSVPHNVPITGPDGKPLTDSRGQPKLQSLTIRVPKLAAVDIRAAKELRQTGKLSQDTIHELRTRGVRLPKSWLPPKGNPYRGAPPDRVLAQR